MSLLLDFSVMFICCTSVVQFTVIVMKFEYGVILLVRFVNIHSCCEAVHGSNRFLTSTLAHFASLVIIT